MTRLLNDVDESREVLGGMSRSVLYAEIKAGRIQPVKVGRRTYFTSDELQRYVASLAEDAA